MPVSLAAAHCHVADTFFEQDNRVQLYVRASSDAGDYVDVFALREVDSASGNQADRLRVYRLQKRVLTREGRGTTCCVHISHSLSGLSSRSRSFRFVEDTTRCIYTTSLTSSVFTALVPKLRGAAIILDIDDLDTRSLNTGKFGDTSRSATVRLILLIERLSMASSRRPGDRSKSPLAGSHRESLHKCCEMLDNSRTIPTCGCSSPQSPRASACQRSEFVFLYPGSLNHHQGVDIAIRAFAAVCLHMPGAELHIVGDGPAVIDLRQIAVELDVTNCVRFFPPMPLAAVAKRMAQAQCGLVPKSRRIWQRSLQHKNARVHGVRDTAYSLADTGRCALFRRFSCQVLCTRGRAIACCTNAGRFCR